MCLGTLTYSLRAIEKRAQGLRESHTLCHRYVSLGDWFYILLDFGLLCGSIPGRVTRYVCCACAQHIGRLRTCLPSQNHNWSSVWRRACEVKNDDSNYYCPLFSSQAHTRTLKDTQSYSPI